MHVFQGKIERKVHKHVYVLILQRVCFPCLCFELNGKLFFVNEREVNYEREKGMKST